VSEPLVTFNGRWDIPDHPQHSVFQIEVCSDSSNLRIGEELTVERHQVDPQFTTSRLLKNGTDGAFSSA
jgi:hypothetical protein